MRYATKMRMAMKTAQNSTKAPISLRQASKLAGFSYEHLRKVYNGEPVGSRDFNDRICAVLDLDPDEMWRIAVTEKITRRLGTGFLSVIPQDKRLIDLWPRLSDGDRDKVLHITEGLVMARELEEQSAERIPLREVQTRPRLR